MSDKICKSLIFTWLVLCISWGFGQDTSQEAKKEPLSEWSKQWLEEVVPYIITEAEKSVFLSLPNEVERGKFINQFWEKRDPDPNTPENEFKIAYYKRIAIANKRFSSGKKDGWRTDRGKIFILLGPPQEIQHDNMPIQSALSYYHGDREIWNYWGLENPRLPYNLEFVFVDKFGSGNYILEESLNVGQFGRTIYDINSLSYHFDRLEILAEAMKNPFESKEKIEGIVTTNVSYDLIPIKTSALCLKGTSQKAYIPLVLDILYANLSNKVIEDKYYFSLNFLVNVSDQQDRMVFQKSKDINFHFMPEDLPSPENRRYRFQTSFFLPPGDYALNLIVLDNFGGKIGTVNKSLTVPDFNKNGMILSDIVLSPESFIWEGVAPEERQGSYQQLQAFTGMSNTFRSGDEMHVYFEVYNLALDQKSQKNLFRMEYQILQDEKVLAHPSQTDVPQTQQKDCQVRTSLKIKNFQPGDYILRIEVSDENAGASVIEQTSFRVID
jgi:GWxTD domain-containing protein